jgi:ribosomal protein S18 acetylase RimI-like enzyme
VIIRWKTSDDQSWLLEYLDRRWGGATMIVRGNSVNVLRLPTLIAGNRQGIAIFQEGEVAELVLLEAFESNVGTGTLLLERVVAELKKGRNSTLRVATTNDNLSALRFYQRRGFALTELRVGGVDIARRLKPSIPEVGEFGIRMTDEIDLQRSL